MDRFAEICPAHAERVLERVLTNDATFTRIIHKRADLAYLVGQRVVVDDNEHVSDFFISRFPAQVERMLERILTNDADFARIIPDADAGESFIKMFPLKAERVFERILTNDADFVRLFPDYPTLSHFTGICEKAFPDYADRARTKFAVLESAKAQEAEARVEEESASQIDIRPCA